MKNVIFIHLLLALISFSFLAQFCYSQNFRSHLNPTDSQKVDKIAKYGIDRVTGELLLSFGYSDTTIQYLNEHGFDAVKKLYSRTRDEQAKTFLSDCIVIGTVDSIEYDSARVAWHSIAHVKVEQYLRNDYKLTDPDVLVMWESGPVGGGRFMRRTNEDQLKIGEHVLLFLSAAGFMKTIEYQHPSYHSKLKNDKILRFKITGTEGGKYLLHSGRAKCFDGEHSLKQIKTDIALITKLLKRPPYDK